jgi:hypothetical protein
MPHHPLTRGRASQPNHCRRGDCAQLLRPAPTSNQVFRPRFFCQPGEGVFVAREENQPATHVTLSQV